MKKTTSILGSIIFGICVFLLATPLVLAAKGTPLTNEKVLIIWPSEIDWKDTEEFPGLKVAVVYGDPSKPGPYVMYAKFEPGFMTKPHYHSADRFVTVISGTWWATIGNAESREMTTPLPAGASMLHNEGLVHFDGAKEASTVVQITGVGPVGTVYVDKAGE